MSMSTFAPTKPRLSIAGAYHFQDTKRPADGKQWAHRITLPYGVSLVTVDVWKDEAGQTPNLSLDISEEEPKAGPHGETALSLLKARLMATKEGGLTRKQAGRIAREYLEALATGDLRPSMRKKITPNAAPLRRAAPMTTEDAAGFDYRMHMTVSFEEERQVWLEALPELRPTLTAMPDRKGTLTVWLGFVPDCPGAVLATVTLVDKREGSKDWWWCETQCIPQAKGDLAQRYSQAKAKLAGMRMARSKVARTRPPVSRFGSNVLSFDWYKKLLAQEGI